MKSKRILSCALALALTLGLAAAPASAAATFPDIQTHWAKSYIEEMTDANMFKGYEDGNFKPENQLTNAEALALCARAVGLDENTGAKILDDYKAQVDEILGGQQSWFYREFAICLAAGILSYTDLKDLFQSGQLTKPIAKEDLSVYLVRAMQLGPMAERLTTYSMSFTDTNTISSEDQPYVYLLNIYGIVQGDQNNAFTPKLPVTRAVMATMLSRSLDFMDEHGITADLPEYTRYDFKQGTISATSSGSSGITILSLANDFTGNTELQVSLGSSVVIYEDNMVSSTNALKNGKHARVCYDNSGNPTSVRVSDALETFDAEVKGVDGNEVAVSVDGDGMILTMDRFTQVLIGKTYGDRTIVEPDGGYTDAVCKLDDQGRLVAIQFTGGSRQEEGIFSSVSKASNGKYTLRVIGFDGVERTYSMPTSSAVTVNGLTNSLNDSYEGGYIGMRVSNEDNSVLSAALDSVTKYVQGAIKTVGYASDTQTITIQNLNTNKSTTYNLAKTCEVTYNGESVAYRTLQKNDFATIRMSGNTVVRIDAYPGSSVTVGVITDRIFSTSGSTMTIQVTDEDDNIYNFALDLSDPPDVERNDEDSTVDKLRVGDEVEVTVRFNAVTRVIATPQKANVTGIIDRIIQEKNGYTLEMTLSDGDEVTYAVGSATTVTQNGKDAKLSDLKPGYRVAMVANGEQVTAIEIQQTVNTANRLSGTVTTVVTKDKYLMLRVVDEVGNSEVVRVNVPSGTTILESDGSTLYLKDLSSGDILEITGKYDGSEFNATIIIR